MKFINKNKKYLNFIVLIFFFQSYYLYFLSIEKCFLGEDICCMKTVWIKRKVIEEFISAFILVILIELIFLNIISKLHLIHIIIVFLLLFLYSNGITFDDHGYYNIKYYFIIIMPILIVLFILNFLLTIKKKKILFIIVLSVALVIYRFKNFFKKFYDCKDWVQGLNKTSIDNDINKHGCLIKVPKSCYYNLGKYFLDRFKIYSVDCNKNAIKGRDNLLKFSKSRYINENTIHIGFPLTNKNEKIYLDENYCLLRNFIVINLIDMNNSTLINSLKSKGKMPEISVDFSKSKIGKIRINLNYNKSLSIERKKLEKFSNPYSNNIIVLYIDSVSRANSLRQLKKTLNFFEKFISYKGNYQPNFPSENFHSFQFFKYHSHKYYTPGNYPILFFGNHRNKEKQYITLHLKKNGFVTGFSFDNCAIDAVRTLYNYTTYEMFDHHYPICDPNLMLTKHALKCFYGKYFFEYMFEYMDQFWRKYKDNRKFFLLTTDFAHEGTLERLKYMDDTIYENLNNFFKENLLKDTSIFLVSDHGVGVDSIYFLNDFYQYETFLPMFFLIVNDRKNQSYESQYKYIYENQQSFITAFDIHDTIIHLIYGDKYEAGKPKIKKSKLGKSLFTKINSKLRSPKSYKSMVKYVCV